MLSHSRSLPLSTHCPQNTANNLIDFFYPTHTMPNKQTSSPEMWPSESDFGSSEIGHRSHRVSKSNTTYNTVVCCCSCCYCMAMGFFLIYARIRGNRTPFIRLIGCEGDVQSTCMPYSCLYQIYFFRLHPVSVRTHHTLRHRHTHTLCVSTVCLCDT